MLRLSDGQAPTWLWRVDGQVHSMLPLSLSTFALAEANGCGLDDLLHGTDEERYRSWIALYALISGRSFEEALPEVQAHPDAFVAFVGHVQSSFADGEPEPEPTRTHRRAKDPREKIEGLDGRTMKPDDSTGDSGKAGTDYRLLFDLSRYARIPLSDIYRMSFRGLGELSRYLKDNPPMPSGPLGLGDAL